MPAMPRMPGFSDLVGLLQQQTEALAALPRTMLDLNRSILSLIEVVASARDTLAATQRVSSRVERIVDELEEPVLALRPGLERLAVILNDPAVDTVPDTLAKINQEVLPLVQGIRDTQHKVHGIATLAEETSTRLAALPGAGFLLGRRRTAGGPTTAAPPHAAAPDAAAAASSPTVPPAAPSGADAPGSAAGTSASTEAGPRPAVEDDRPGADDGPD